MMVTILLLRKGLLKFRFKDKRPLNENLMKVQQEPITRIFDRMRRKSHVTLLRRPDK